MGARRRRAVDAAADRGRAEAAAELPDLLAAVWLLPEERLLFRHRHGRPGPSAPLPHWRRRELAPAARKSRVRQQCP